MGKLTDAVERNDAKTVETLLAGKYKNSPLINEERHSGEHSALGLAASYGCVDIITLLLNYKADIRQLDKNDLAPLHWAARNGHVEAIQALINKGANINQPDKHGWTPLRWAACYVEVEAIQALINKGANINQPDKCGWTPLHEAAYNGNVEVVQILLNADAKVNLKTKTDDSKSPLDMAKEKNHTAVVDLLQQHALTLAALPALKQKQSIEWEARLKVLEEENKALSKKHEEIKYLEQDKKALEEHAQTLTLRVKTLETEQTASRQLQQQEMRDLEQLRQSLQQSQQNLLIFQKYGLSPEERAFQQLLTDIKRILDKQRIKAATCFISYAWEDIKTLEGKVANEKLHKRLLRLESDLGKLGIKAFLDIKQFNSNMHDWMQKSIETSDFIFLIGTPRLKERAEQNTNVAFEFTHICAKTKKNPKALIPLLYTGEFNTAFPDSILKEGLIRDFRNSERYFQLMTGLFNPLGVIPSLYPVLIEDEEYKVLFERFEERLQNIQKDFESTIQNSKFKGDAIAAEQKILPLAPVPASITPPPVVDFAFSFTLQYTELTFGKELGRGSFGVVHQGTYRYNEVAIKQLHLTKPSQEALEEFKQEMNLMANLRCPQIIQFYGVYTSPSYGIVMEYMPMGSLYDVLHSNKTLDWSIRYSIALDISKGVSFLHKENILHRDLKSLNVLLDGHWRARITDFGLSKIKTETVSISTNNQQVVGTLLWMAPELFKRKAQCTQKSDMYSLGMTLWELASRKRPFEDALNPAIAVHWIQEGQREEIPADCPPKIAQLITFCWNKEASKRPSADEAVQQLLVSELKKEEVSSYRGNLDSSGSKSQKMNAFI